MAAAYAAATRSLIRASTARAASSRIAASTSAPKTTAQRLFGTPKPNRISSPRIFRSPVELSSCVESLLPYHTATASALLTSLLSGTPRCYGWTMEDCNDDV